MKAYPTMKSDKRELVVIDGNPGNGRLMYGAKIGSKYVLVIDGSEGNPYDAILAPGGHRNGQVPAEHRYIGASGNSFYAIDETVE